MAKVVYLFGAGVTQSELDSTGWTGKNVLMSAIKGTVNGKALLQNPAYKQILDDLSLSTADIDVEQMISLLDDLAETKLGVYSIIANQLRRQFFCTILENLTQNGLMAKPRSLKLLFMLHKKYSQHFNNGEELAGVLTVNFDSLADQAFEEVYGSVNYGVKSASNNVQIANSGPQLLKLHGSFNWSAYSSGSLFIDKNLEFAEGQDSKCLPPSAYKKLFMNSFPYTELWKNARKLLESCDTLRIIGCSLRKEDWPLISLIFSTQVVRKFCIDIVLPTATANEIEDNFPFLGSIHSFKPKTKNAFLEWVSLMYEQIADKDMSIIRDSDVEQIMGIGNNEI